MQKLYRMMQCLSFNPVLLLFSTYIVIEHKYEVSGLLFRDRDHI